MNKLVAVFMLAVIALKLACQLPNSLLFMLGPFNKSFCSVQSVLYPAIVILLFVILNAITLARYALIFHFKNPTEVQDEFWTVFIVLWGFTLGIMMHFVYLFMPGKNNHDYYFCIGKISIDLYHKTVKVNYCMAVVILGSVFTHIYVDYKYKKYLKTERKSTQQDSVNLKKAFFTKTDNLSVANVTLNLIAFVFLKFVMCSFFNKLFRPSYIEPISIL